MAVSAGIVWLALSHEQAATTADPRATAHDSSDPAGVGGKLKNTTTPDRHSADDAIDPRMEVKNLSPFKDWLTDWEAGRGDLQQGLQLARERKATMHRIMKADPELAHEHALEEEKWKKLPKELQAEVEHRFSGVGKYDVRHDCESEQVWRQLTMEDFSTGNAIVAQYLLDRESFHGVIRGVVQGNLGAVVAMEGSLAAPAGDVPPPPDAAPVTGTFSVLWLNVKFSDEASGPGAGSALSDAATSFNTYSYGRLTLNYQILAVSIAATKASNPGDSTVQTQANAAAQALGYNPANYDTVLYRQSLYGQYASLGTPGTVFLSKSVKETTVHEIAHTMGIHHANWWKANAGQPAWGTGVNQLYGEDWDAMAFDNPRGDFNAPEKIKLGWLQSSLDYRDDVTSGVYRIYDYRNNTRNFSTAGVNGAYYAVSVYKDSAATNGENSARRYVLSYKDFTAVGATKMTEGLYLHWYPWTYNGSGGYNTNGPYGTDIIDTHPTSANGVNDAPLSIGETYVDNDPGNRDGDLFFTVLSKTDPDGIPQNGDEYLDVKVVVGDQVGNSPPTGTLTLTNPVIYVGGTAQMSVSASDPNNDTLSYLWDFGLGTTVDNRNSMPLNGAATQQFKYSTVGTYTVKVTISDGRGGSTVLTQTLTVNPYTVTFDANGGITPTPASKSVTPGLAYGTLATTSRTGFAFNGWYTAASGGTLVTSATTVTAPADHTLYAQWTSTATYTVSYLGNGNTSGTVPSNQTKTHGVSLTLATNTGNLAKTGYGFAGWNTAANGSGTAYVSGAAYTADSDVTLYTQWNALPVVSAGADQTVALSGTPWSPAQLTPQLWLDADDASSITLNGTTVSEWRDKSGFSRHASQTTAGSQPTQTAAALNGKSVLTFDGATDFLNLGTGLDFLAGVSHSAFIVAKPTAFNNIYGAANGNAGANSLHVGFNTTTYRMNYWANDYTPARTANFVAGSANIVNYIWTPGTSKQILANGISEGTTATAGVIGTMSGGGRIGNIVGQGYIGGDIAEMVFLTGTVSTTDREAMEGYLAHKWGLSTNLAAGHPYKNSPPGGSGAVASISGTATDTDPLTYSWSSVSGPASVSFANSAAINTSATFTVAGVYTLRLTANDGTSSASSDIVITVNDPGSGNSVTYSGNGSTGGAVPVDASSPYANGATVTVLGNTGSLVRTGYTFNNWNTAANGSGTNYAPGNTFTIGAATTLYAKWTPNTYAVTYNGNSATSGTIPSAQTKTHDINLTLQNNSGALARTGYMFAGWNAQADGLGADYAAAGTYSANAAVTLYAKWTPNTYAVTYDANSATSGTAPSNQTKTHDVSLTLQTNSGTLARAGYTFAGWNTLASGGGTDYAAGAAYTTNAAITLYAKWTANSYSVTFDGNGGGAPSPSTTSVTFGSNYGTLATTNRTGHTFNGWFTAASGGTQVTTGTAVSTAANHTLYAQWTADTYIVTYMGNGSTSGTVPADQIKTHDINLTIATNSGSLAKTGYTFTGWNTAANGSGTAYAIGATYSANAAVTLYAQWTLGNFLAWDANGTGAGQTNGGGTWEGANLWWNGTSNSNWVVGASATFGGVNTAGGAVTLAAPATVENITFNQFTGTYTLGTAGQAITINSGITMNASAGAATISSPITLGGLQAWTNNSANTLTIGGALGNGGYTLIVDGSGFTNFTTALAAGAGGVTKNGTGRMQLNNAVQLYTGPTTVNGGVLSYGDTSAQLSAANITLNGGVIDQRWTTIFTRALGAGDNQIRLTGGASGFSNNNGSHTVRINNNAATEVVWGAANEAGNVLATGFFNPSIFVLQSAFTQNNSTLTFDNPIDLNGSSRTIEVNPGIGGASIGLLAQAIRTSSGTAGITKTGGGILILGGTTTYNGGTTISGGTLRVGNGTAGTLGSGNYAGNISIASGSTLQIWSTVAQTLSGTISGAGNLHKAYGGTLTLSGPNTYTGRTSFLPQTTAGFTVNITSFNSVNGGNPLLASSSLGAPTTIANGTIDVGDGGKQAGVTLNYTGPGETTDRVINFGFNGTSSQTLTASGSGLLKFSSAMTSNATTQSGKLILDGTGGGEITQTLPALPSGGLTKNGTGTWTLGGNNSYTGPTAITAGKLIINGDQSAATGAVTVSGSATLGGTGTLGGSTTIATGGKLEFNLSTAAGSHNPLDLIAGKDFTFSGTSTLTITSAGGASPGIYTLITGGNIIGSAPSTLVLPSGWAATVSISDNSLLLNVTSTGATYTVTYSSNNATAGTAPSNQMKTQDVALTLATNTGNLARAGYTYAGWNTSANGSGTSYAAGAAYTANAPVTLYAMWNATPYTSWTGGTFAATFTDTAVTSNPDGDNLTNLQEFAFGTDPTSPVSGSLVYVAGGNVVTPGCPIVQNFAATGQPADYRAVFARRKDHIAAGLTYTVHYSVDLGLWTASSTAPTPQTGAGSTGNMEAVSVPFPATVPLQAGGSAPPKFFRVAVTSN